MSQRRVRTMPPGTQHAQPNGTAPTLATQGVPLNGNDQTLVLLKETASGGTWGAKVWLYSGQIGSDGVVHGWEQNLDVGVAGVITVPSGGKTSAEARTAGWDRIYVEKDAGAGTSACAVLPMFTGAA